MFAQGPNFEDWGDLLVIAVMAILWLVGGLAKVITSRKKAGQQGPREGAAQPQRRRESWQERLARKAEEMQRAAEARSGQANRKAPASSRPTGKITVRQGPRGESVMVYERPTAEPVADREQEAARQREAQAAVSAARQQTVRPPAVEPGIEVPVREPMIASMATVMSEPPEPLGPGIGRPEMPGEPAGHYHPATIIDYTDPDALQKAVLHYEILGKPLAFREPAEESGSF